MFSAAILLLFLSMSAQQDETREIWDTGFLQKRPVAAGDKAERQQPRSRIVYKPGPAATASMGAHPEAALGLTIWRLRTVVPGENADARLLVPDTTGSSSTEMIPERIGLAKPLHAGDRIRISIEVPHRGYLYVIDRERYRDGSRGDPVLIYPASTISPGGNRVEPGQLIDIPSENATVRALRLEKNGERHVGEDLMLMITPELFKEISPGQDEQQLAAAQVNRWDSAWALPAVTLDLAGPQHNTWTLAEKKAGNAKAGYLMTQNDPMPEMILSIPPHADEPVVVHVQFDIQ